MQEAEAEATERERTVKELGFRGALINGQTNGHYLDAGDVRHQTGVRREGVRAPTLATRAGGRSVMVPE